MNKPATRPGVRNPAIPTIGDVTLAHLLQRTEQPEEGGCLLWSGYTDRIDSPQWRIDGKCWLVRRLLWTLTRGPVPHKQQVAVACGVPACVHPDHLICRTRARVQKGKKRPVATAMRIALGKRAALGRLTPADAAAIRSGTEPLVQVATRYGIAKSHAWRIRRGEAWRDYSNPFTGLLKP